MSELLVRNVRPPNEDFVDLRVIGDRIEERDRRLTPSTRDATVIDAGSRLLFPGFIDAHAHLDKTLLGMGWYRNEVGPELRDKVDNERRMRRERDIDFYQQSSRLARRSIAAGTTQMRTFVDIDTDNGLAGFEGVMNMREEFKEHLSIQVVAFPQSGMLVRPGTVDLMEDALRNGADAVGGLDPSAIDRDPVQHLNTIFNLAAKYDVDIDIHLHEPGELGAFSVELIAERTRAVGWQGRVTISHAFCLGAVDEPRLDRLIGSLLENRIAIMTHGPSGDRPFPPVKRLRDAGVEICSGNDGIRDAWGPLNMPDMLLRAFIVSYRNNFRRDDEIETVVDIVTHGGARVLGNQSYGLEPGCTADFVIVDGETHVESVIERPPRWLVVKSGRIVARDGECLI